MSHLFLAVCGKNLSICLPLSFTFILWSTGTTKDFFVLFCIFLINIMSGRLTGIRWSACILKSQRILCVLFSRTDSGLFKYYLMVWSNFDLLHNYQWITFPTQSCLVLYFFCSSYDAINDFISPHIIIIIIIIIIIYSLEFSHQHKLMVFHWSLWQQVSSSLQDSPQYSGRSL